MKQNYTEEERINLYDQGCKMVFDIKGRKYEVFSKITGELHEIFYCYDPGRIGSIQKILLDSYDILDEDYIRHCFPDLIEKIRKEGYAEGFKDALSVQEGAKDGEIGH